MCLEKCERRFNKINKIKKVFENLYLHLRLKNDVFKKFYCYFFSIKKKRDDNILNWIFNDNELPGILAGRVLACQQWLDFG